MSNPIVPRPAATVMLVRDGDTSLEVLMLRRSLQSAFMGGAYVFPGGAVDPGDGAPAMLERCSGRTDAEASVLLDLGSGGLQYWVSAFRECFEEAGVLVARGPGGAPITFEDPAAGVRFSGHRHDLNAGRVTFLDVCLRESLVLPADDLFYVGHWITPEGSPRRFDTRFFVALAPAGQTARHDEVETIGHMWVPPGEALAQYEAGQIQMVAPTIWNLRLLARFAWSAALLSALASVSEIPSVRPVLVEDGRGGSRAVFSLDPELLGEGAGDRSRGG